MQNWGAGGRKKKCFMEDVEMANGINFKSVLIWRLLSRITNLSLNYKFIIQFSLQKFTPPLCFGRAIEGFNVVTTILKVGKGQDIVFQYWNPI